MLAGVGPARDALLLRLLTEREHLVPGLRVRGVELVQRGLRVPDAVDRVGVVQHPDRVAIELAHLDDARPQGVADRLGRVVDGGGVEQRGEVGELLLADQDAHVHLLGTGVVDQVRRGAAVEARLEDRLDLLRRGELDLRLGVGLLVDVPGLLRVLRAEPAVEDDDLQRGAAVDGQRVLVGLLALGDLVVVAVAAAARAGGEEAHRRNSDQAECGGTLDQIATAKALIVVSGGGSHAQVLAFSRTQAVYRSPVENSPQAKGPATAVSCARVMQICRCTGEKNRRWGWSENRTARASMTPRRPSPVLPHMRGRCNGCADGDRYSPLVAN